MSLSLLAAFHLGACGSIANEKNVETLFEDFQPTIAKIIERGLAAKEASTSGANITPITAPGASKGTLTIGGKVAQGNGANENLDLWAQLDGDYSDTGNITYATNNTDDTTKLKLAIQVQSQPQDNTMSGTLVGPLTLKGDVTGAASFNLVFKTDLADDDAAAVVLCSRVTGTVTAGSDSKTVDFVLPKDKTGISQAQLDKCAAL